MKKLLALILVISISLSLLAISIEMNSYNKKYYTQSFERYGVVEVTGKSMDDLEVITEDIILYLKGRGGDELLNTHFNEREVLHMRDVQDLFNLARTLKYTGLFLAILIVGYYIYKKEGLGFGRALFLGPFVIYGIFLFLALIISRDFNKYFTYFHLIFFTNDLWILDPNKDLMIQMLPEPFFMGIALRIMLSFLIFMSIIQLAGFILIRKGMKSDEKLSSQVEGDINN
ncbi:MAG: TIGR01906 family membrane protein [Tissierellaceae bacterium]